MKKVLFDDKVTHNRIISQTEDTVTKSVTGLVIILFAFAFKKSTCLTTLSVQLNGHKLILNGDLLKSIFVKY